MLAAAAALLGRSASRHCRCFTAAVSIPPAIGKAARDAPARNSGPMHGRPLRDLGRRASAKTFAPEPVQDSYDAIVVGGGHNGLVAALLLAREGGEGFRVALFDADETGHLGGAARTERPFSPRGAAGGLRHSTGAYLLGPFPPELLEFCGLGDLPVVKRSPHYFLPPSPNGSFPARSPPSGRPRASSSGGGGNGGVFFFADDEAATRESFLSAFSEKDWLAMKEMERELGEIREAFAPAMLSPSPETADDAADAFFPSSPSAAAFVSLVQGSVADYLAKFGFESETLKAMFCATDGLSGATASPYDVGTGYNFLLHNMVRLKGTNGAWALVEGGMGTVTQRLAENARRAGAALFRGRRVASIDTSGGGGNDLTAEGVTLSCGKRVKARVGFVAACDPWALCGLSEAVAASSVGSFWPAPPPSPSSSPPSSSSSPTSFRERLDSLYVPATTFKLNLALSALPEFACLAERGGRNERGGGAGLAGPEHKTTTHLVAGTGGGGGGGGSPVDLLHDACVASLKGDASFVDVSTGKHPPIEFYFHSAADPSVREEEEEEEEEEGDGVGGGKGEERDGEKKRRRKRRRLGACHSAALFVQLAPHAPGVSFLNTEHRREDGRESVDDDGRRASSRRRPLHETAARPPSFGESKRAWTPEATDLYAASLLAAAEAWCPGLRSLVADAVPYPPPLIEARFGISGGAHPPRAEHVFPRPARPAPRSPPICFSRRPGRTREGA